jgi:arsenate reductase
VVFVIFVVAFRDAVFTSEQYAGPSAMNVLFLCTGNSARSIMAEALLNQIGGGRFHAFSAGSHPTGQVHPLALDTLAGLHVGVGDARSKSWDEFASPVCDQAAAEVCPTWPGQPVTAHWGVPDPAAATGAEAVRTFRDACLTLRRRVELLAALPLDKLSRLALGERLTDIGKTPR